jgi:regulator of sigma E protease
MNETVLTWIVFILAFGGMVLIHELGHFIAARLCKIEVEEFGIGLPTPGAITLFQMAGHTLYSELAPLGGFVRPKGENDPNVPGGLAAASPWKRLVVLFAGPDDEPAGCGVIYAIIFSRVGVPDTAAFWLRPSPLRAPPLQPVSRMATFLSVAMTSLITNYDELRVIVDRNVDKPVEFLVDRSGEQVELTAIPR